MSLSGPVPRSHSPDDFGEVIESHAWVSLEAELVSQPRGFLVIFAGDRLAEAGAEPQAIAGALRGAGPTLPTCRVAPWYRWTRGNRPAAKTR